MTYPFVSSFHDLGPRRGPILALTIHMAEGGGTVGFLHKRNPNAVSVHFVIEYDGDIVQMLREDHMHSSIRIRNLDGSSALRTSDDKNGFYGATAAKRVLGGWAYTKDTSGPNHATLAVEVEGFAKDGPNAKQAAALERLVADLRTRYPKLGLLGHRDHNVKTCPGRLIPWDALGGHAVVPEEDMERLIVTTETAKEAVIPEGRQLYNFDGTELVKLSREARLASPLGVQTEGGTYRVVTVTTGGERVACLVRSAGLEWTPIEQPQPVIEVPVRVGDQLVGTYKVGG